MFDFLFGLPPAIFLSCGPLQNYGLLHSLQNSGWQWTAFRFGSLFRESRKLLMKLPSTATSLFSLLRQPESRWLLLFSTLPLLVGSALAVWALDQKEWLLQLSFGGWFLFFSLLSLPIGFSLIPNTMAGIVAGYLLGMWGLPGMVISFSCASVLGFYMGRFLDSGLQNEIFRIWPSSKNAIARLKDNSVLVVMAFRLLPVPPFAIGSLLLAWLQVSPASFFLGSMAGMLPRMALMVWLGSKVEDILFLIQNPMQFREVQGLSIGAGLLGIYLIFRLFRKKTAA
jgi:uncharacterized membrane protein YdjX (TVP38/TMEM64 family)